MPTMKAMTIASRPDSDFLKFFLFDVLTSTIIGVVTWFVTRDNISSLLISLVTGTILLVVDLRFQLRMTKEEMTTVLGFYRSALDDPFLMATLGSVNASYGGITESKDAFFASRARDRLAACSDDLTRLRDGIMEVPQEEIHNVLASRVREAKQYVFATSIVKMDDVWSGGSGKEYLHENLEAVQRGIRMTRVFIVEDAEGLPPEAHAVMTAQSDGGIEVKIATMGRLGRDLIRDMILVDDRYAGYADFIPGSITGMQGLRLHRTDAEIQRAKTIRDRILRESDNYAIAFPELARARAAPLPRTKGVPSA